MILMTEIKIISKDNDVQTFSLEKLIINMFELTYTIGEPNIELSEKISKTIFESLLSLKKEEVDVDKLDEIIKENLKKTNTNLYNAYISRHKQKEKTTQNLLKSRLLLNLLGDQRSKDFYDILKSKFSKNLKNTQKIIEYIDKGYFYPSTNVFLNTNNSYYYSSQTYKIQDDIEDIFKVLLNKSNNNKYNIPTSINLSNIRSKNQVVSSTKKKACGIKNIIDFYIDSQNLIINNNIINSKNTFYLNIEHPDSLDFLSLENINQVNVVYLVPTRFMTYLIDNQTYYLKKEENNYSESTKQDHDLLIDPFITINTIFSKLSENNNINFVFIDKLNKKNFLKDQQTEISSVGFQPVLENDSFFTGVVDVSKFYNDLGSLKTFDWNMFKEVITNTIYFLNDCIDNSFFLSDIKHANKTRRIYLSITGYYKLLQLLDVPYNSDDSLLFGENLSEFISYFSKKASVDISKQKEPFLYYNKSRYIDNNVFEYDKGVQKTLFSETEKARKLLSNKPVVDWDELKNNQKKYGLRNLTTYSVIFSDYFSYANNTTNSINLITNKKNVVVFDENHTYLEDLKIEPINNQFLIKLQNVFEKFCDGLCNINLFYEKNNDLITNLKKDFVNTYLSNNLCFLPKIITNKETVNIQKDNINSSV